MTEGKIDRDGITIPKSVFFGVLTTMVAAIAAGAFSMGVLYNTVGNQKITSDQYQRDMTARIAGDEADGKNTSKALSELQNRLDQTLARMEAQLNFVVTAAGSGKDAHK
jgi:hypothetical protein